MPTPVRRRALLRAAALSSIVAPAALFGPIGLATAAVAPPSAGGADASPAAAPLPKGKEVPGLETARSRTWLKPSGAYETRVYGTAVNVKNASGVWTPIDNTLSKAAGGAIVNGNGPVDLTLPSSLSDGAVKVAHGGDTLSLTLRGAGDGAAAVSGATATYADAAPGVAAKLSSTSGGLKEDLLLASASAQRTFTYDVALSDGLKLQARKDGGIDVVDAGGKVAFALAAPLATDAKGDVASGSEATMSIDGDAITVSLDQAWLSAPGRAFPVTLDPSATLNSARDCYLDGANTTTTYCSAADLWVGSSTGHDHKAILNFNVAGAVPAAANITFADLNLYPNYQTSPGTAKNLSAHEVASDFDNTATWVKRTSTANWTTAGGDIDATDLDSQPVPASGAWSAWEITNLVSGWVDGSKANRGVALTDDGSTADNSVVYQSFDGPASNDPYLDIEYFPRTGAPADATILSQPISATSSIGVNPAGGNLLLQSQDLQVAGTGLPVSIQRFYNSQDPWTGTLGAKGRISLGNDIALQQADDRGDRILIAPGGARYRFIYQGSGAYKTPAGAGNVTLKDTTGGRHELTDNKSGLVYGWYSGPFAYTDDVHDADGNHLSFTYLGTGNTLSKITDTRGRQFPVTSNTDGFITSITVPTSVIAGGQTWTYGYNPGDDLLTSVTDPEGNATQYTYTSDGYDLLTKVHDPRGNDTLITYDTSQRVTSITRRLDGTTAGDAKTTYAYQTSGFDSFCPTTLAGGGITSGETTVYPPKYVTDPSNNQPAKYCFSQAGQVLVNRDNVGHVSSTTFNPQGNSLSFGSYVGTSGVAANSSVVYDTLRGQNPTTVTDQTTAKTTLSYPASSNDITSSHPTQVTDPQGTVSSYTWSGPHLASVTAGSSGFAQTIGHRTDGQINTVQDGNGNTTTYGYNANGELTSVTPQPLTPTAIGASSYTYDGLSRVATYTDGRGKTLTYGYDKNNRLKTILDADGKTTTLVYDGNGNITSRTEGTNTTSYVYDALNRKTSETFPGSIANTYTYDQNSNLKTLTDASGTVTYGYDAINRTTKVTSPTATTGTDDTTLAYTDPTSTTPTVSSVLETLPGGGTIKQTQDLAGKLTDLLVKNSSAAQTMHRAWDYSYTGSSGAAKGELVDAITDYGTGSTAATTTTYQYGLNNTLTDAKTVNGTGGSNVRRDQYTYDNAGNRKTKVTTIGAAAAATTTYAYNADNELCWQIAAVSSNTCTNTPSGATSYTYDGVGNQLTGQAAMTYDGKNRLKTLGSDSITTLSPTNFEITAIGSQSYGNTVLGVNRTNVGGTLDKIVRLADNASAFSQVASSAKRWYVTDQLGSTIALVDSAGTVGRSYSYDPDGGSTTSGTGPDTQIKYAGGVDIGNGLYHYGARFYSPTQARWTQQDPLDQPGDLGQANRYLYAADNQVNFNDPSGEGLGDFVKKAISRTAAGAACISGVHSLYEQHVHKTYTNWTRLEFVGTVAACAAV